MLWAVCREMVGFAVAKPFSGIAASADLADAYRKCKAQKSNALVVGGRGGVIVHTQCIDEDSKNTFQHFCFEDIGWVLIGYRFEISFV